jgi:hypothetical protein
MFNIVPIGVTLLTLLLATVPLQLDLITENPGLIMLITLQLLFILGVYLMYRRTLLAFTEGMRSGKDR